MSAPPWSTHLSLGIRDHLFADEYQFFEQLLRPSRNSCSIKISQIGTGATAEDIQQLSFKQVKGKIFFRFSLLIGQDLVLIDDISA